MFALGTPATGGAVPWAWSFGCETRLAAIGLPEVWLGQPSQVVPGRPSLTLDFAGKRTLTLAEANALLCTSPEDVTACRAIRMYPIFQAPRLATSDGEICWTYFRDEIPREPGRP